MLPEPTNTKAALEEAKVQGLRVVGAGDGLCASCRYGVVTVCEVQETDERSEWKQPYVQSVARCLAPRSAFGAVTWRVTACAEFVSAARVLGTDGKPIILVARG